MCTFQNDRAVLVCDIAIERVRDDLDAAFPEEVRFTSVDGQGTLVEAAPTVDAQQFTERARAAIAAAQATPPDRGVA